jgi:hypothetical protein
MLIGQVWANHHVMFGHIRHADRLVFRSRHREECSSGRPDEVLSRLGLSGISARTFSAVGSR